MRTFFSTDIIRYQNQTNGNADGSGFALSASKAFNESFSKIALDRWLQVTVPLTCLTLGLSYAAFEVARKKQEKEFEKLPLT
jgi:hypothetical protein